jgi:hypothetical protein
LDGHSTLLYPYLLPEWHIASPERHPQWNIIRNAANLEEDFTICYGVGRWWRRITVSSEQYGERKQKEKERRFHIRYECKTAEGRRNFTTPCTTAGTSWRFSDFSLVFQTCILSRFVSFVFFCCVFFFLLPPYAPSMNTNSSYVSFILSYTVTPFVFFFLVFLYLLDSVPSLTSFSFPSSTIVFFLSRLASTLYSMISPVVSVLSSLVVLYSYRFPEHFFFSPLLCSFSFSSYSLFPYFSFFVVAPEDQSQTEGVCLWQKSHLFINVQLFLFSFMPLFYSIFASIASIPFCILFSSFIPSITFFSFYILYLFLLWLLYIKIIGSVADPEGQL